jgi:hypothetical protein
MRNWRSRMEGVSKILLSERRGFGISNQSRPIWRVAGIPLSVADPVLCLGSLTGRTRLATRKARDGVNLSRTFLIVGRASGTTMFVPLFW